MSAKICAVKIPIGSTMGIFLRDFHSIVINFYILLFYCHGYCFEYTVLCVGINLTFTLLYTGYFTILNLCNGAVRGFKFYKLSKGRVNQVFKRRILIGYG